jgi:hypothetical protein
VSSPVFYSSQSALIGRIQNPTVDFRIQRYAPAGRWTLDARMPQKSSGSNLLVKMKLSFVLTGSVLAAASLWLDVAEVRSSSLVGLSFSAGSVVRPPRPPFALATVVVRPCRRLGVLVLRPAPARGGMAQGFARQSFLRRECRLFARPRGRKGETGNLRRRG